MPGRKLPASEKQDPLVGERIIRIMLETFAVHIQLDMSQVQIGSVFYVRSAGSDNQVITPEARTGHVSALWPSIGSRIASVAWGDDFILRTGSGIEIVVPPSPSGHRGTILSHDGTHDMVDEF